MVVVVGKWVGRGCIGDRRIVWLGWIGGWLVGFGESIKSIEKFKQKDGN